MTKWVCPKAEGSLSIEKENPLLAKLLLVRNINTDEKVKEFLNPETVPYIPFSVFKKANIVIERIFSAIADNEKICIYGDFDTDGVTSTAILYKTLQKVGANVCYYLPDRDFESHGLNTKAIINLISKQKVKLIITVDCGVSNINEVKLAKTFKTDIIITDHHEAPEDLPDAFAIINPKAQGVLEETLSAKDIESLCCLSGAGISFKLANAILKKFGKEDFIEELLPIAALGTIGDIVPLVLENRRIVYSGLNSIKNKVCKGITKLFENAGVKDFSKITSETVAFTAVPRINATGRLESAETALKLLISEDESEMEQITKNLNELNSRRQLLCEEAFERSVDIVQSSPELYQNSIVICDEEAHVGIIGLSASRLVERYNVPSFVMRKDENIYRCSCRGLAGVNIYDILNNNKDLFLGYGGHEFAGGFSFDGSKVSFEQVRKAINDTVLEQTNGQKLEKVLNIDLYLKSEDITEQLVETVKLLEPFGAENPAPIFAMKNLKVSDYKFMGQLQNHLKLFCNSDNGKIFECIKWSTSSFEQDKGEEINLAFSPEINEFNGKTTVQLLIKDMQFPNVVSYENPVKFIDCRNQKEGYDKIADFLGKTKKRVGIYTENQDIINYFAPFETEKDTVFQRDFIPQVDMCICVDTPPSLDFLKKIVSAGTKEILFMHYESVQADSYGVLTKIAGMMRYVKSSLNGKTDIKAMRKALGIDDDITKTAINTLKNANIIDANIDEKGTVSVNAVNSAELSKVKDMFGNFKTVFEEYCKFVDTINFSPVEEIKKLVLK